jgi:hypothetical protein
MRMNCVALAASLGLITESWLATIPTGKPAQYELVISLLPLSFGFIQLTHDMSRCRDHIWSIFRLEDRETGVIHNTQQDFVHVKWLADIRVHD